MVVEVEVEVEVGETLGWTWVEGRVGVGEKMRLGWSQEQRQGQRQEG